MTWREFKEEVERQGVKDEDEITFIDLTLARGVACMKFTDATDDKPARWWIE
jgi:hypothetical protein